MYVLYVQCTKLLYLAAAKLYNYDLFVSPYACGEYIRVFCQFYEDFIKTVKVLYYIITILLDKSALIMEKIVSV